MKNRREKKYIFQLMLRYKKELILNTVLSFFSPSHLYGDTDFRTENY